MKVHAILPAAGLGIRLGIGPGLPKALLPVRGVPMVLRSLRALEAALHLHQATIAVRPADGEAIARALSGQTPTPIEFVTGGQTREESVRNAFRSLRAESEDHVVIHDADRPLVEPALVKRVIEAACATGAAICALHVTDTLKEVTENGHIARTHPRERFYLAQTPQVFRYEVLAHAYILRNGASETACDEAAIVESAGFAVYVVDGSSRNIKITFPEDLDLAERLLE